MKPRLEPAPLTDEDIRIWRGVCCFAFHVPSGNRVCAEKSAQTADRRDAALMLRLASPCPACSSTWQVWRYFWSDPEVWQRCGVCGNIRLASNITYFA